jgi:pantetheine-phosphate adenylyltransferase
MTIALYPGGFDPLTRGHMDVAIRASNLFEKVIIGVYDAPTRNLLFSTEERVELIRQSIAEAALTNVCADSFKGLVVDYARALGAKAIVRGLRVVGDFEREFSMALMNKKLDPDCEVVCLMASVQYQFLSASLLKEVSGLGGFVEDLVPKPVARALKKKLLIDIAARK